MSKEKKYRFYFSQKQSDIDEDMFSMPTRFVFVKTPNGYKQYSECCSLKGSKCNWSDAELVYETDDEPEIITHECVPELIANLEHRLSNCIEPKFKIGQEIWETIPFMDWEVTSIKFETYDGILYQMYHLGHKGTDDYNCCVLPSDSDRFFATEEEAKAKLEELKNDKKEI